MIVHLIDGTYELFRHFYGLRRFPKGKDLPFGAVVGVLNGVLQMMEFRSPWAVRHISSSPSRCRLKLYGTIHEAKCATIGYPNGNGGEGPSATRSGL